MPARLSRAQWRMLEELAEPNGNPGNYWFFPRKSTRTLLALANAGLAKNYDEHNNSWAITDAGRQALNGASQKEPHGR